MSTTATLYQEFFCGEEFREPAAGGLQNGDNLPIRINGKRYFLECFQESFSCVTGSPGIVVAGVRAGGSE